VGHSGFCSQRPPCPVDNSDVGLYSTTTPVSVGHRGVEGEIMEELLLEYAPLFQEPSGLPPHRNRTHHIHLLPGMGPVAVCPYRYAYAQKAELEQQCVAMLQSGVIHPSSSAFSVPVLLVKNLITRGDFAWITGHSSRAR
jgi:hypothetical protein